MTYLVLDLATAVSEMDLVVYSPTFSGPICTTIAVTQYGAMQMEMFLKVMPAEILTFACRLSGSVTAKRIAQMETMSFVAIL